MRPKVVQLRTKKPRHPPPEIEDVQEAFCGQYRNSMTPLADHAPMVAAEWFYQKNCGWGPEDFSHGSNVRAYWECQHCLRVYKATIANRVGNQSACPYCASKKVCSDNALSVLFPEIANEWHPSKNGKLKATAVTRASAKRAWWRCSTCAFEWETAVSDRTYLGSGCPSCHLARIEAQKAKHVKPIRKPIIIGETEVPRDWYQNLTKKYKSLAKFDPKVAKQWHPTKNGKWTPKDFSLASGVKAWWLCKKGPDHEWQATICKRTRKKSGCPFCAGQKVSQTSSLKYLFPELAKQWHKKKNGQLKPTDITTGTDKKVWWQCAVFSEHAWEAAISSRVNKESGCPFCSGTKVSAQNCLQNEFPNIAAQLHPTKNGGLTGKQITAKSSKKVWWICKSAT